MRQHSGAPAPKRNRRITRRIFPPDSEKSSGNETRPALCCDIFVGCFSIWIDKKSELSSFKSSLLWFWEVDHFRRLGGWFSLYWGSLASQPLLARLVLGRWDQLSTEEHDPKAGTRCRCERLVTSFRSRPQIIIAEREALARGVAGDGSKCCMYIYIYM